MAIQPIAVSPIVAQAFRFMDRGPISSLADDSPEALDANQMLPVAMRECLERCDWSFASSTRKLSPVATGEDPFPDDDLPWLYQVPGDVVALRQVGESHYVEWRLDRDGLRANASGPLKVRYTGTVDNEAALPAGFQMAVALRLACLLGAQWLESETRRANLEDQFSRQIKQAMRDDARSASAQRYDDALSEGDWATGVRL